MIFQDPYETLNPKHTIFEFVSEPLTVNKIGTVEEREAKVIADRIAVMYLGKIMEIGPAERVIRAPHHPYTQALVSVSPSPDPPTAGRRAKRTILVGETPDAAHVPSGCRFHPRCPYAFDRCRVEEPPLFDVADGQRAACWLAEGGRALPVLPPHAVGEVVPPGIAAPEAASAGAAASPADAAPGRAAG
jgi:oligopeptide/dipeptide ABC transporter ATP-binding protein